MSWKFKGFTEPNYTQTPDALFDELLPRLNLSELRVLLYIIRRTFGFKKHSDNISLSQIMHGITTQNKKRLDQGTGLSKKAVMKALRSLKEKNIIVSHRNKNKAKGNLPTTYSLNLLPLGEQSTPPLVNKVHQGLVEKDHHTTNSIQETDNNVNVWGNSNKENHNFLETLAQDLAKQLNDHKSLNFYKKVINKIPRQIIYRALGETRELKQLGKIKKNMGACFTDILKRLIKERGISIEEEKKPVSSQEAKKIISQIKKKISEDK